MIRKLSITTLVDNTVYREGLIAEHGLAFFIEADDRRILFDTGQGQALLPNAHRLDIPLNRLDAIVLSHGHFDHTGALAEVLAQAPAASIYFHPAALEPKYARRESAPHRRIGMPQSALRALQAARARCIWTAAPTAIAPGVTATGEIPRRSSFEDVGGLFYKDGDCQTPDAVPDDQALFLVAADAVVVVLGCAHAGVVNTLEYIRSLTLRPAIHAVLGGMHLRSASGQRIEQTASALEELGVRVLAPAHCTGSNARIVFRSRFPHEFLDCSTGSAFVFPSPPTSAN
jgi:7,8-dihydropterin-6-yl-methyl-4-(beta-D-ribofuranosyl)aminobenzene 5'-phosphate synthase